MLIKTFQYEDGRIDKQRLLSYLKDPLSFDNVIDVAKKIPGGARMSSEDEEY